jgi:hypothetical protein
MSFRSFKTSPEIICIADMLYFQCESACGLTRHRHPTLTLALFRNCEESQAVADKCGGLTLEAYGGSTGVLFHSHRTFSTSRLRVRPARSGPEIPRLIDQGCKQAPNNDPTSDVG